MTTITETERVLRKVQQCDAEWCHVLTGGRPAVECAIGKCGIQSDGLNCAEHLTCDGRGSQPALTGLLVPCLEEDGIERDHSVCLGQGECVLWGVEISCHGTGFVLNSRLADDITEGEWGAAIGRFEDRLEAGGWYILDKRESQVSINHNDLALTVQGFGPNAYAAVLDAIEKAVER